RRSCGVTDPAYQREGGPGGDHARYPGGRRVREKQPGEAVQRQYHADGAAVRTEFYDPQDGKNSSARTGTYEEALSMGRKESSFFISGVCAESAAVSGEDGKRTW